MHCPNCGTVTAPEQRFCRSCGLNLEKIAELVAEQLPAMQASSQIDSGKADWRRNAERAGLFILLGAGVIFFLAICWAIVSKIIIARGEYLSGSIFLVLIIALVLGGSLLGLSDSSGTAKQNRTPSKPATLPEAEATARLLSEPELEPVPSVTERTTALIDVDKKGGL